MMQLMDVHSLASPIDFNTLINIGVIMTSVFIRIMFSFPTISNCNITKLEQVKRCDAMLSEFHYKGDTIEHEYCARINRRTRLFYFK